MNEPQLPPAAWVWLAVGMAVIAAIVLGVAVRDRRRARQAGRERDRLRLAMRSTEQASAAQNRFFAAASHDLRQPLHALGLYLSALGRHLDGEPSTRILASAQRSADTLNQLLNGLLDLSRLESGVAELDITPFPLRAVVESVREGFEPLATERGLTLATRIDDVWVETDRSLLERMLRNLVGNALNYTQRGGVQISTRLAPGRVLLDIEDTGPGIPSEARERVFDAHRRLAHGSDVEGVGLGLSIVRRIATLLNIGLALDSETGAGSTFELALPTASPDAPDPAPNDRGSGPRLDGHTILVIDDDREILDGMVALFGDSDVEVVVARSSTQAIDRLIERELVPDLILADYRLRDGELFTTAIERVRDELNEDVPAAILTGETATDTRRRLALSGLPVLQKPVDVPVLFDFIARHLETEPA